MGWWDTYSCHFYTKLYVSPRRYSDCDGHTITPRFRLLPVCGSYSSDSVSIIIAKFIFSSRVSIKTVFEVIANYSLVTPLLNGVLEKLINRCEDVIEFSYSYNSSVCSSDSSESACSNNCPDCQLNSVTYLHSTNCTKEIFLFVHTTCANFSIPGTCIGRNSPKSSCCLRTADQDNVTLPAILASLCLLFLVTIVMATVFTTYRVIKTRYETLCILDMALPPAHVLAHVCITYRINSGKFKLHDNVLSYFVLPPKGTRGSLQKWRLLIPPTTQQNFHMRYQTLSTNGKLCFQSVPFLPEL